MASLDEALEERTARSRRATSYLISGGCVAAGTVPFLPFLPKLRELRARGGRLNFHVGLVGESEAAALAGLADTVSFDLVADDGAIRDVLGLDARARDYVSALRRLRRHVSVVPHILIGLNAGRISGEPQAVEAAAAEGCESVVFIVFIPTPGTRFAACRPPDAHVVAGFLARARLRMPSVDLGLGCMRPGGSYRRLLDPLAVWAGVQRIVQPSVDAVLTAEGIGLRAVWSEECCVL
jgi:hypothetical protein